MAIRTIDDSILQGIAVAIQAKDNGSQMTVDQMAGRIENINNSDPVFEQIVNRSASGVIASSNVKHLMIQMFCELDTITGVILNRNPLYIGGAPISRCPDRMFDSCSNLKFVILPHLSVEGNNYFGSYVFYKCINLKLVVLSTMGQHPSGSIYADANNISNLVITNDVIIPLINTNTFNNSAISNGTCNIYVLDALKDEYKITTNWSVYASQFKGYSEAPNYDASITYTIGDICKHNNKLYGWINETDGNSTPTGNVDEFNDWYCISEITEVFE